MTEQLQLLAERASDQEIAAPSFRPIHYLGSKARVLDVIVETLDSVDPSRGRTVDLFSGSAVVAARLSRHRSVAAVDIQEYARVLASAVLSPATMSRRAVERLASEASERAKTVGAHELRPLVRHEREATEALFDGDPEPLCCVVEHGSIVAFDLGQGPPDGRLAEALSAASTGMDALDHPFTLTRYYGGVYFSYMQALGLDCLLAAVVASLPASERDTALAAVLGAASACVTSVGNHFAQPVRPRDKAGQIKVPTLRKVARRRERDVVASFTDRLRLLAALPGAAHDSYAVCADFRSFLDDQEQRVTAVYADPPYTRDHYSRFYHVFETMVRGDTPDVSQVVIGGRSVLSRGLYRSERHQSPFCIRSEASEAFRALFDGVAKWEVPLVLSYSPYSNGTAARPRPRLMTITQVVELAQEAFSSVLVRSAGRISHSKFNTRRLNGLSESEAELFVICQP